MENPVMYQLEQDIWIVEGPIVDFYGFPYPTRSVIIRLRGNCLWVWSPSPLTRDLKKEVDKLGEVGWLIGPNKLHHLYLCEWQEAYREAELWGPPSLVRKRNDLVFTGTLGNESPPVWAGVIDQLWFNHSLLMDEVIFFHRASRTAILADLSENFSTDFLRAHWAGWQRSIARLWRIVQPWGYAPLELRVSTLWRRQARAAVERMLDWNPRRVILAHGEWVDADGQAYLAKAFGWLR